MLQQSELATSSCRKFFLAITAAWLFVLAGLQKEFARFRCDGSTAKVGKVPTFRASDTDTDLPIVSTDHFSEFQYLKNRFIASK
jgi:hypothetical protein